MLVKDDLEVKDLQLQETTKQQADTELSFLESIRDLKRQSELDREAIKTLQANCFSLEKQVCSGLADVGGEL